MTETRLLRIGYFADGPWSHRALMNLLADPACTVVFVCARHDAPDPKLRDIVTGQGLPFVTHPDINADDFRSRLAEWNCDLFVSMSFNQIFKAHTIELPPLGTINCHAGKLPFYRGRNVLNWALINDEPDFGITVHYVDTGIDTGDIILQDVHPIADADDYASLLDSAYRGCADILHRAITAVRKGVASRIPQTSIHPVGSYCSMRRIGDEVINWEWRSREVFNFVRALCRPGPGASTFLNGTELKIEKVETIPDAPVYRGIPGAVLRKDGDTFLVKTGDSLLRVLEWSGSTGVRVGDRFR